MLRNFLAVLAVIILFGCGSNSENSNAVKSSGHALEIKYSTGLEIWEDSAFYRITVRNPQDTSVLMGTYIIAKNAGDYQSDTVQSPVDNVILNSTTFAAYFSHLNAVNLISGISYLDLVKNTDVLKAAEKGTVQEITSAGELDFEKVLSLNPDVFMAYSFGESNFDRIQAQGIPVLLNMEYMESSPLGRVEWIKMVGCLIGKLDESVAIFNGIAAEYESLVQEASKFETRPSVFTGSRYKDFWYAPGNASYIANYIRDAGGDYTFNEFPGNGSVELEYEAALASISDADYWGLVVSEVDTFAMADVLEMNEQYSNFKSYKEGKVFVCNAAKADYFGDAVMEPNLVLADLIHIFHSEAAGNYQPNYFRSLTPRE